jgi:hypothetical protein
MIWEIHHEEDLKCVNVIRRIIYSTAPAPTHPVLKEVSAVNA